MQAKAIVGGRLVSFKLSPEVARAHRANAGKTMTDEEAVAFVKKKRHHQPHKTYSDSPIASNDLAATRKIANYFDTKEWRW
jgi:hypothetical protein